MNATTWIRPQAQKWRVGQIGSIVLVLSVAWTGLQAQKIERGRPKTVAGVVKRFTTDVDTGEIDGMVLDDGTIVHWWPHLTKKFTSFLAKGDRVEVTGKLKTINRSQTVLEADTITNLRTKVTRINEDVPLPLPRRVGGVVTSSPVVPVPVPREIVTAGVPLKRLKGRIVTGTVKSLTKGPAGVVDGMVLDKNMEVHWPARLSQRFTDILAKGDRVEIIARDETLPSGKVILRVGTITNLTTRQRRTAEEILLPPPEFLANAKEKTLIGIVKRFTLTPEGERDGMLLEDGTLVHWPPPFGEQVARIADKGDKVKVVGLMTTDAIGNNLLVARSLTNVRTGKGFDLRGARPSPIRTKVEEKSPDRDLRTDGRVHKKLEDLEKRMKALEDKMDRLLKAVEQRRQQQ